MQKRFKKGFRVALMTLTLILIALLTFAGEKQALNDKVAVVNGKVISKTEFDREMSRVKQQFASQGRPLNGSQLSQIKKEVLESLINRELLYQESKKKGIKVDKTAINNQLKELKKRFSNEAEYKNALSKANLSEAIIKSQIKTEMAIRELIDRQFSKKVTVSDEEAKSYYNNHLDSFKQPEQIRASHILIKVDPQANELEKEKARKRLIEIKERLQKGEDFATLAKEFSQCPSGKNGGDLGYFKRGQMVKPFEEAAFALEPGEISDVVETRFGYHLIKVFEKKPTSTIAYVDIREKIKEFLKKEKTKKEVEQYIKNLKEKAKVERFLAEEP